MSRTQPNPRHPFWVEGYYGPGGRKGTKSRPNLGRPGELEGDLAFATVHSDAVGRDIEIAAAEAREDIGVINHGYNPGVY